MSTHTVRMVPVVHLHITYAAPHWDQNLDKVVFLEDLYKTAPLKPAKAKDRMYFQKINILIWLQNVFGLIAHSHLLWFGLGPTYCSSRVWSPKFATDQMAFLQPFLAFCVITFEPIQTRSAPQNDPIRIMAWGTQPRNTPKRLFFSYDQSIFIGHVRPKHFRFLWFMPSLCVRSFAHATFSEQWYKRTF